MIQTLVSDVRSAWTSLRRSPRFVAAAVLTLAAGTAATLAIFTVVNGVFLAPLPYASPDRLVHLQGGEDGRYAVTMPLHNVWSGQAGSLDGAAAWQGWSAGVMSAGDRVERRSGAFVSWNWFELLGQRPAAGRFFLPDEGVPGHAPVIVVSHSFWRELEAAGRTVVGGTLLLDGSPWTVVGVAPPDILDPVAAHVLGTGAAPAFWAADPPRFFDAASDGGWVGFWSVGRLRAGATPSDARAELVRLTTATYPDWTDDGAWLQVRTFRDVATGHLRATLMILFGAAALVLLIACANVANLLLSRATARTHEMIVRSSLGATRLRLIRQLLSESLLLATAAVALGLVLARMATPPLVGLVQGQLRQGQVVAVDFRVAVFAAVLALVTSIVFGLAPALQTSEVRLAGALRSSRGARGAGSRTRAGLVAAEVTLGVVVLVAAGLLGRTLWNLRAADPGFDAASAYVARATLEPAFLDEPALQNAAVDALQREVRAIPGVTSVGAITDLPMSGAVNSTAITRPGAVEGDAAGRDQVLVRAITHGYFEAMGVPLLAGRTIAATDVAGAQPVAVINRSYAARLPDGGLGETVVVRGTPRQVVGVVEDVVEFRLVDGPGDPALYTPYPQEDQAWMRTSLYVVARTSRPPASLGDAVRAALARANPGITVSRSSGPLENWLAADVAAHRFRALLLILFASVSLLLAAAGIAAVTAYTVAQRVPEIGIRMALGATSATVLRGILGGSARSISLGLVAGIVAAIAASRILAGYLYGIEPRDPAVFVTATALLSAVALLATWIPARRAAAVDPVRSLRSE